MTRLWHYFRLLVVDGWEHNIDEHGLGKHHLQEDWVNKQNSWKWETVTMRIRLRDWRAVIRLVRFLRRSAFWKILIGDLVRVARCLIWICFPPDLLLFYFLLLVPIFNIDYFLTLSACGAIRLLLALENSKRYENEIVNCNMGRKFHSFFCFLAVLPST